MWDTIKERFTKDSIFLWLAIVLITYINNRYFDKHISTLLFILPIMVMDFLDYTLKRPPKYPKVFITILIIGLYLLSLPKYTTMDAENLMKENYGDSIYLLHNTDIKTRPLNPYSKDINYLFFTIDGKEYLFNARTGEVKEKNRI